MGLSRWPWHLNNRSLWRAGSEDCIMFKDNLHHVGWLEVISVRAAGSSEIGSALEFCLQIVSEHACGLAAELALYRSAEHATDLSMYIYWHTGEGRPIKSVFGVQLARALSDFGIINHTLWLPQRKQTGGDAV
jgi:hypothetical protein